MIRSTSIILALGSLLALGCGEETSAEPTAVTLNFAALVGGETATCGTTYTGLGMEDVSLEVLDYRYFVHDVRLLTSDGGEVPVTLTDDDVWQTERVALLDFETGCGDAGTAETNSTLRGTIPAGSLPDGETFDGIAFRVGVPFEDNHVNPDAPETESPLNITAMWWNWTGGYKFVRIEGRVAEADPPAWNLHLGSTGCTGPMPMAGEVDGCMNGNRLDVELTGFDPLTTTIGSDIAPVLEGVGMMTNTEGTPQGCMAGPTDPECDVLFDNLGLSWGGEAASGPQQLFFAM